ncbi:MAG: endonuclease, partial [Pseudomonadota bacterium]
MARALRLATYNVEWFDKLFDADGALLADRGWSGRHDVTRADQIAALGRVFCAVDADAFVIIEAPDDSKTRSTARALEAFAQRFSLRQRAAIIGFSNHTQQEIALLYDPDVIEAAHDPGDSAAAPRFDTQIRLDLDLDDVAEEVRWSKPPLELLIRAQARALEFRLIGVHAKSKAPFGARTPEEVMRLSIANRKKQLAQCIWLRRRVSARLEAGEALIVAGDFNDGPGLDEYEKLFGRSSVEIVLGQGEE